MRKRAKGELEEENEGRMNLGFYYLVIGMYVCIYIYNIYIYVYIYVMSIGFRNNLGLGRLGSYWVNIFPWVYLGGYDPTHIRIRQIGTLRSLAGKSPNSSIIFARNCSIHPEKFGDFPASPNVS